MEFGDMGGDEEMGGDMEMPETEAVEVEEVEVEQDYGGDEDQEEDGGDDDEEEVDENGQKKKKAGGAKKRAVGGGAKKAVGGAAKKAAGGAAAAVGAGAAAVGAVAAVGTVAAGVERTNSYTEISDREEEGNVNFQDLLFCFGICCTPACCVQCCGEAGCADECSCLMCGYSSQSACFDLSRGMPKDCLGCSRQEEVCCCHTACCCQPMAMDTPFETVICNFDPSECHDACVDDLCGCKAPCDDDCRQEICSLPCCTCGVNYPQYICYGQQHFCCLVNSEACPADPEKTPYICGCCTAAICPVFDICKPYSVLIDKKEYKDMIPNESFEVGNCCKACCYGGS